jgi:glutathione peroxidase-family protein/protocatechuate 3,4-dioxygenase beta subunit
MRPSDKIERLIRETNYAADPVKRQQILNDASQALRQSRQEKPVFWRTIMMYPLTKYAVAAVIVIAAGLFNYYHTGSVDIVTIAFADISDAMKKVPWMHQVSRGFEKGVTGQGEQWIGFEAKVFASKTAEGKITYWNINEGRRYEYDPNSRLTLETLTNPEDFPLDMLSPLTLLESMNKMLTEQGAEIVSKTGKYNGQTVQIQDISLEINNQSQKLSLYIEPATKLLIKADIKSVDASGNILINGEAVFDYPSTGPASIYDLGVPREDKAISMIPSPDLHKVLDAYRKAAEEATKNYIAAITASLSGREIVEFIQMDYKSGKKYRGEDHKVFESGQSYDAFWPEYQKQLGDSLASLLVWTQKHFDNPGYIRLELYDGSSLYYNRRENNTWENFSKQRIPTGSGFITEIHLKDLGWPNIGTYGGNIIEDDYAKQNNLICIEELIEAEYAGVPVRRLFYIDPQKNYLCVKRVSERDPNAPWQKDKTWLKNAKPEDIEKGEITITETTEHFQSSNGLWYPKIIVRSGTSSCKDYKEKPLKINSTKNIYLDTNPQFPDGIFDPAGFPKSGSGDKKQPAILEKDSTKQSPNDNLLQGRLVDASGNGINGTIVINWSHILQTDQQGIFAVPMSLSKLLYGNLQVCYALNEDKTLGETFLWKIGEYRDTQVSLEPLISIYGKVIDANGKSVNNAEVQLCIETHPGGHECPSTKPWKTEIKTDGSFCFSGVPIGAAMKIIAEKHGFQGSIIIAKPENATDINVGDLVLKPLTGFETETTWDAVLSGCITNEKNQPMPGLNVDISSLGMKIFQGKTNRKGQFTIKGLPRDKNVSGSVYAEGYGHTMFKIKTDGSPLNLQLFPQGYDLLNKPAPGLFAEKWFNTEPITLEQFKGKVILLQISAMLPIYQRDFETIQKMNEKYGNQGLGIIVLHARLTDDWAGPVTEEDILAFIKKHNIQFPFGIDDAKEKVKKMVSPDKLHNGAMYSMYDVKVTPALYLIDKKGLIRISPTEKNLEQWIKTLLAE